MSDMQTVNISLPVSLYSQAKAYMENTGYASISEVMRQALRKLLRLEELTENGYTKQAEESILKEIKKPTDGLIFKQGEDVDDFFDKIYAS
jgi:Arc/MetJ-type ribon-helix-helix transcriptional regulator